MHLQKPFKLLIIAAAITFPAQTQATDWYVATTGSPTNSGKTVDKPLLTIQQAADSAKAGDKVIIRGGTYRETVTPVNSGTAGNPIVYKSYPGERAIISGADPVTGFTLNNGIYQAPLTKIFRSKVNQSEQVFVDGVMLQLARWPNTPKDVSLPVKSKLTKFISKSTANNWTTVVFEDDNIAPQTSNYYVGSYFYVQPSDNGWSWTLSGEVTAQSGKTLTIRSRNDCGQDGDATKYPVGARYFLAGQKQMLDANGEWYHDTSAGVLYLRGWEGANPAQQTVEMKMRDFGFVLDNKSYVTVQGISFFGCALTTDWERGGDGKGYNADGSVKYPWKGAGDYAMANHIIVDSIQGKYLSHFMDVSGHFFLQYGQHTGMVISGSDNIIQNSIIQYSCGNGITLIGKRSKAYNNYISDVNYLSTDCSGINTTSTSDASDMEISYNTITRCGRSGITPRSMKNSDRNNPIARIHHNDISFCMLQDNDGGGLYCATGTGNFVRVDHNWVHDISKFNCCGLYIDWTKEYIMDHNVIWNVEWGIQSQGYFPEPNGGMANATLIYNNTIAVRSTTGEPYGPFGFAGNVGGNIGSVLRNNIVYCSDKITPPGYTPIGVAYEGATKANNLFWDNISGSPTDPLFANTATADFTLKTGSAAIDKGMLFTSIDVFGTPVTTYNDPINGTAPDIGAYENGGERWIPGCRLDVSGIPRTNTPPLVDAGSNALIMTTNTKVLKGSVADDGLPSHTLTQTWAKKSGPGTVTFAVAGAVETMATFSAQGVYVLTLTATDGELSSSDTVRIEYKLLDPATLAIARFTPTALMIDGDIDAPWSAVGAYPIAHTTAGTVLSATDLSGTVRLMYNKSNLYLLYEITDDSITDTMPNVWENDGVEAYLDIGNKKNATYGPDDYQYCFRTPGTPRPAETKHAAIQGVVYKVKRTPGGYRTEVQIPWTTLGATITDSTLMGFDAQIVDNDSGKGQTGKLGWNTINDRSWMDPTTFGTVMFVGGTTGVVTLARIANRSLKQYTLEMFDCRGRKISSVQRAGYSIASVNRGRPGISTNGMVICRVKSEGRVETLKSIRVR